MKYSQSALAIVAATVLAAIGGAQAAPLTVINFSFEDNVAPVNGVVDTVPSGWTAYNQAGGADIGSQNAGNALFTPNNPLASPAQGNQFTYVNIFANNPNPAGGIFQDVGSLLPNTTYTLTVAIGSRADRINSPGIISLINGFDPFSGIVMATGGGLPSTQNTWQDYSISFTTGSVVSDDLVIALSVAPGGTIQADFDNVRLDAVAVPEPSSVAMLALGGIAVAGFVRRRLRKSEA
jgi:hypothetical protein